MAGRRQLGSMTAITAAIATVASLPSPPPAPTVITGVTGAAIAAAVAAAALLPWLCSRLARSTAAAARERNYFHTLSSHRQLAAVPSCGGTPSLITQHLSLPEARGPEAHRCSHIQLPSAQ